MNGSTGSLFRMKDVIETLTRHNADKDESGSFHLWGVGCVGVGSEEVVICVETEFAVEGVRKRLWPLLPRTGLSMMVIY